MAGIPTEASAPVYTRPSQAAPKPVATTAGYAGQTVPGPGQVSGNMQGSYQEWFDRVVASLIRQYTGPNADAMLQAMTMATGAAGQPDAADKGSGAVSAASGGQGGYSYQTEMFFENYVKQFVNSGAADPWMTSQFGAPPSAQATFGPDPNSAGAIQTGHDTTQAAVDAADNANRLAIAQGNWQNAIDTANIQANTTRYGVDQTRATAIMDDATRRYVAEGDWGTQKYVADLNNKGQMDRLLLQLQAGDKDRAQAALAEQNRHHEQMVNLALEVAKYDADLASKPHNWIAYATWLGNRNIVVNGLSLAMAADAVPQTALPAQEVAQFSPSASISLAADTGQIAPPAQGTSPTNGTPVVATAPSPRVDNGDQTTGATTQGGTTSSNTLSANSTPPSTFATLPTTPSQPQIDQLNVPGGQVDLNSTDYAGIANKLMGVGANTPPPTSGALQTAYNSLSTQSGTSNGALTGSGGQTNALGMRVNTAGAKENGFGFNNLSPDQQDMKLAAANSGGVSDNDFLASLKKNMPKGAAAAAAVG